MGFVVRYMNLPGPGIELRVPALAGGFLTVPPVKALTTFKSYFFLQISQFPSVIRQQVLFEQAQASIISHMLINFQI